MLIKRYTSMIHMGLGMVVMLLAQLVLADAYAVGPNVRTHPSPSATNTSMLTVEDAVTIALAGNAGFAATQAGARAMSAIPEQVGTLPDPRLMFNLMNIPVDSFSFSQEPMTQIQLGIKQKIPFPGKLNLRRDIAVRGAEVAAANVAEFKLRLVQQVKTIWWKIFYLDRALETVARNKVLLKQLVDIAQTKYKVGQGLQQDVLLAQLEQSKLLDTKINLRSRRRKAEAGLNALFNRNTELAVQVPARVSEQLPAVAAEVRLRGIADTARPMLRAHRLRLEAARTRVKLARRDYYPDFMATAVYGYRDSKPDGTDRPDFASLMLGINLPLYAASKQYKVVDQRRSEVLKYQHLVQDSTERIAEQISRSVAEYKRTRDQVSLFKQGIIPQANQTVASMLAGYQVNKVDFLNLVRSQITLYNYETRYWKALTEAHQALAKLTAIVGKEEIYE